MTAQALTTHEADRHGIAMAGIVKRFGNVVALADVDLSLVPGEVHALLGENGAGKSTLLAILSGMQQPDVGEILIAGERLELPSPATALARGIATVYQHFTLVPTLSVRDNLLLGIERSITRRGERSNAELSTTLSRFGIELPLDAPVGSLPIGVRQRVEIAKALLHEPHYLLLDEPTSVLAPAEVEALLTIIRTLATSGIGVLLVTHKLNEALAVSDRVTVLRAGRIMLSESTTDDRSSLRDRLVTAMFGGEGQGSSPSTTPASRVPSTTRLRLIDITTESGIGAGALTNLSLDLRGGEILGLAGVAGNGQRALGEVIAGQRSPRSGRIELDGRDVTRNGVAARTAAGVGMTTDERLGEGIVASLPVELNLALKQLGREPVARGPFLNRGSVREQAERLITQYEIRPPDPHRPAGRLSGGNIQKLLLARELAHDPAVLVCVEPTTGLDLRTATRVHELLRDLANKGRAVLLISSDLDELLEASDRIAVIYRGRIAGTVDRIRFDRIAIGHAMLTGEDPAGANAGSLPAA